jgi:YHS domain-containing protein
MDIHTERGDENCQQVNVASQHMGGYTKWNHSDIQTQRETCNDGLLTSSIADAYNNSSVVRDGFSAKPTHKETFNKCPISYIGGANHTNSFGHNSSNLQHNYVRPTSRSVSQCSKTLGGPAMSSIPTNASYKQTYEGSRGYTSRENTLVSDYTPIKTSNNAMINTSGFENSTRYREDNNIQNIASNASVNSVNNFKSLSSVGNYGTRDRSGVENKRDFGFAPGLNANNPYALDINRK